MYMAHRFSLESEIPGETRKNQLAGRKMKKLLMSILTVIAIFALKAHAQVDEPLKLIQTIPLSGLHDGDFDHFALDLSGQRLFLAAEDNSAVEVFRPARQQTNPQHYRRQDAALHDVSELI